jgi:uncharacterized RDD family membrane protein YckC
VHTLGFVISFAMVLPQLLSAFFMVVSGRGQGLSDLVLGSVVINRSARF